MHLILCTHNVNTLDICMKIFDTMKIVFFFIKMTAFCSQIVHEWGIQLEPQLLLLASDTLYTQCRHIGHLHKEV